MNRIQTTAMCLVALPSFFSSQAEADIAVLTQHMQFVEDASNPYSGLSVTINVGMDLSTPDLDPDGNVGRYEFGTPTILINSPSGGSIVFLATREGEMTVRGGGLDSSDMFFGADWIEVSGIGVGSNEFGAGGLSLLGFSDIFAGNNPDILTTFEGVVSGELFFLAGGLEINGIFQQFVESGEAATISIVPAPSGIALVGCCGLFAMRRRR